MTFARPDEFSAAYRQGSVASPSRRSLLKALALSPAAVMGGVLTQGQSGAAKAAGLIAGNACLLLPEVTEGPYYLDTGLVRRNIVEDREGERLTLRLQVVDADCAPIEGARIDVWHCDAQGNYSGVDNRRGGQGEDSRQKAFLRGTQATASNGVAEFDSLYPGWYRGRTTHVHYKVFLNQLSVLIGQLFFPDDLSSALYTTFATYARPQARDTLNAADGIARRAGPGAYAQIETDGRQYVASLVIGVDAKRQNWGGWFRG